MDVVIDPVKADHFFFNLRTGFTKNLTEILIGVGFLLLLVILFIIFYLLQKKKNRQTAAEEHAVMYLRLREKHALTAEEESLVDVLSGYAKDPGKKYLLLSDQAAFNAAFTAMKNDQGDISHDPYTALKHKLGFKPAQRMSAFESTRDLPPGIKGALVMSDTEKYRVMVLDNSDAELSLSLVSAVPVTMSSRKSGRLFVQNASGISEFPVTVKSVSKDTIMVEHGAKLSDIQRRNFFRKTVGFPVIIMSAADNNLQYDTAPLDLSGGGLSFLNPDGRFKAGDEIVVDFKGHLKVRLVVTARVIRVSKGNRVVHAAFANLKDSDRDLIIGALNR